MSNQRARAHAKHAHYCSCGKVVWGNGGKAGHAYMHERRQDGHGFIGPVLHRERFPEIYEAREKASRDAIERPGGSGGAR